MDVFFRKISNKPLKLIFVLGLTIRNSFKEKPYFAIFSPYCPYTRVTVKWSIIDSLGITEKLGITDSQGITESRGITDLRGIANSRGITDLRGTIDVV